MFAYCLNNPVNCADYSGELSKKTTTTPFIMLVILDGSNGGGSSGGGGGIDPGIILITLLERLLLQVFSKAISEQNESTGAVFYGVDLFNGSMNYITGEMDFNTAATWAVQVVASNKYSSRESWGLYTEKRSDAEAMTIYLGQSLLYTHDEKKKHHYAHYHTANREIFGMYAHNFHMWYGN